MGKYRLLLLPFGVIIEILILAYCWLVGYLCPRHADRIGDIAKDKLPEIYWYIGE